MNILTDTLPEAVEIDGKEYAINFGHRTCVRIIEAFEDPQLTEYERVYILLHLFYPVLPDNTVEALKAGLRFLDMGKEKEAEEEEGRSYRLYSFKVDSDLIYAAYRQTHGVDLSKEELHWWAFVSLFNDLGADTAFCQLVALRKRVKTGKASKEDRAMAAGLGSRFHLEDVDTRSIDMKEAERQFMEKVNGRKNRR